MDVLCVLQYPSASADLLSDPVGLHDMGKKGESLLQATAP